MSDFTHGRGHVGAAKTTCATAVESPAIFVGQRLQGLDLSDRKQLRYQAANLRMHHYTWGFSMP